MYDAILVAIDGSEHASEASTHAIGLAEAFDATLHGVYVIETRTAYDNAIVDSESIRENFREIGETALSDLGERADQRDVALVTSIEEGVPAEEILEYAVEHDVDYLFVGERGHSSFKTVLLGSTTEQILSEATVPVTVV